MVDLVKIRKKKAEKKAADEAAAAAAGESSSRQVDESSSARSSGASAELAGEGLGEPVVAGAAAEPPVIPSVARDLAGRGHDDVGVERSGLESDGNTVVAGTAEDAASAKSAAAETPSAPQSSKLEKFKAEAGKRRETAAAQQEQHHEGARLEALTFLIAGEQYAVDIEKIVEIVTPRPITRIPNSDQAVLGIISLRGTIVTLLDVRQKLRHPPAVQATADTRIVVIDSGNETIGFTVDRVLRVVKTTQDSVEPHPVVHAGELNDAIRGVFRSGDALTILLDLDKLLDHNTLAARPA